jgi:hypothetical protein
MLNANEEEVRSEDLEANDTEDETTSDTEEATEESEESETESPAEETVTLSKSDYDKIRRGAAAAARLRGKGKESGKEDSKESAPSYDQDLIARTFLAAQASITDPEVQDEALRLANKFGMKIDEALKDTDIASRLQTLQKQQVAKRGVAGGNGAGSAKPKGIEYHVAEYRRTNKLPDDPRLVSEILDELVKKN